jgi:AcrR family transcriptional regulator
MIDRGRTLCQPVAVDKRLARGQSTRDRLLAVATSLFAARGYDATPIEMILDNADVSRGALYHHFTSKEAIFDAVLDEVEGDVAAKVTAGARGATGAADAIVLGCRSFLRLARDPIVRQVVLLDAPAVVGWDRWREIDAAHALGLLRDGVAGAAIDSGLPAELVEPIAHVVLAALLELALIVARSDHPRIALRDADRTITVVVERLLAPRF